jgi:AraC-like DNA-binding protein
MAGQRPAPTLPGGFTGVDFARGRLFDTADLDEAREVCGRVFNPHRLGLVGPTQTLRARMDHLPLGPLSLNRLTWGARVQVDPDRLDTYCLISVPVQGTASFRLDGERIDVSPRQACIVGATQRFRFEADAAFDQIVVRFECAALDEAWAALTGAPPAQPPELRAALPLAGAAWRALEPVLQMLADGTRGVHPPAVRPHVQRRLHDLLLATLLLQSAPALAAPPAVPLGSQAALVRRAQEDMLAQLTEPLTLSGVARASGVAARTLQSAFQAQCGMGPMQWLREQRLDAVHHTLRSAADAGLRVTDTAHAYGFSHLGEFSRAYRRRFGESAGHTLARR